MTNNEKIASWAGFDTHTCDPYSFHCDDCARGSSETPDYENVDTAAVTLLPVLVDRGHVAEVIGSEDKDLSPIDRHETKWECCIDYGIRSYKSTISKAITSAILQLIESEASNERV